MSPAFNLEHALDLAEMTRDEALQMAAGGMTPAEIATRVDTRAYGGGRTQRVTTDHVTAFLDAHASHCTKTHGIGECGQVAVPGSVPPRCREHERY